MPAALQVAAGFAAAIGVAVTAWAMAVNPFFSATVRIQSDRGHVVVERGPYRTLGAGLVSGRPGRGFAGRA